MAIILDEDSKSSSAGAPSDVGQPPDHPPPSFEESMAHIARDDPPVFAPYNAQYTTDHQGNVTSSDEHLNEDGEALFRFLLQHAAVPPSFLVRCTGTHKETHVVIVRERRERKEKKKRRAEKSHADIHVHWTRDPAAPPPPLVPPTSVPSPLPFPPPAAFNPPPFFETPHSFSLPSFPPPPSSWFSFLQPLPAPLPSSSSSVSVSFSAQNRVPARPHERRSSLRKRRRSRSSSSSSSRSSSSDSSDSERDEPRRKEKARWREREVKEEKVVTDFQFSIDLARYIAPEPAHFVLPEDVPAYRGGLVMERAERGRPRAGEPWEDPAVRAAFQSSLRGYCHEYCAGRMWVKEFVYEKFVVGWNTAALTSAIEANIAATGYRGSVQVRFDAGARTVRVRRAGWGWRVLGAGAFVLLRVLGWVCAGVRGKAGRWNVARGAWQMRVREGEWFGMWEAAMREVVMGRVKMDVPMREPGETPRAVAARALDGYVQR